MKRILLISDVKGWGGWNRGEMIKKHLSDEFHFDLILLKDFSLEKYPNYNLYYPLFHTMLINESIKELSIKGKNVVSIVTGSQALKPTIKTKEKFQRITKNCKAIFANSIIGLKSLREVYDGPTFYVPRGVDPDIFYPEKYNTNDKFKICYVGKPVPEKGLNEIIRPVAKRLNIDLIINTKNFTKAVSYDKMRELYNKSHCYIVASTIDGTPNPALECASCARPVISNKIGNMPEFIQNYKNGFLIEREIEEYIKMIKWMMENREQTKLMGKKAREEVLKNWSWEQTLKYERKALKEILM